MPHHFEAMDENHWFLVFAGESSFQGFFRRCRISPIQIIVTKLQPIATLAKSVALRVAKDFMPCASHVCELLRAAKARPL